MALSIIHILTYTDAHNLYPFALFIKNGAFLTLKGLNEMFRASVMRRPFDRPEIECRALMPKPPATKKSGDKRKNSVLRKQAQTVFEVLIEIMREQEDSDLADGLASWSTIEDVMRTTPAMVGHLLQLAWSLRTDDRLAPYFNDANGMPIELKDAPIAPCNNHYSGVTVAHLQGTARLFIAQVEREWAKKEANARAREYADQVKAWKRSPLGLVRVLFRSLFGKHPRFLPADMLEDSPKKGLYPTLKPHLREPSQFTLITAYAKFNKRQVDALEDLIRGFLDPTAISRIADYDSRQIPVLTKCCWLFADTVLVHPDTSKAYSDRLPKDSALADGVDIQSILGGQILSHLMMHYEETVPEILKDPELSECLVSALCVPLGETMWSVFSDEDAMQNIRECPVEVVHGVGDLARHIPVNVSVALRDFENPMIIRDLLIVGVEAFGEPQIKALLSDPMALPVWQSLPHKFNHDFNYSRDSDSPTTKNIYDLRDEAKGIYRSLMDVCGAKEAVKEAA